MECRGARKAWGEIHQRGSRGPGQHTERDKGGREGEWELGQKGGGGVGGNGCARGGVSSTRHRKTSTTHRGKSCVLVGGGAGGGWRVVRGLGMGEGGGVILGARDAESWRVLSTRQRRTWTTHGDRQDLQSMDFVCVWLCVVVCGCVWLCVVMCGCVWLCVVVGGGAVMVGGVSAHWRWGRAVQ